MPAERTDPDRWTAFQPQRRALRIALWLVLVVLSASPSMAVPNDLEDARSALQQGRHASAMARARPWLQREDASGREARLITAEAQVELGQFAAALRTLGPLMARGGRGAQDAGWMWIVARAFQGQGLFLEAADWWLTLEREAPPRLARPARAALASLLEQRLGQAEIAYLLWKYPRHAQLCEAAQAYAREERRRGHLREARRADAAVPRHCGGGADAPPATATAHDFFTVGVLAPLNGAYARYGISLTHGIDIARRLKNARARFPLGIEIADTQGDPRQALEAVARLHDAGVRIFVGEIFSLNTLMIASYLHDRNAVLISPAATDSTISHLGAGVYDCLPGAQEQLRALVTCAAESLGVRRVALLWPEEPQGRRWRNDFRRAAQARGLAVVLDRAYRPGRTDFTDLIGELGGQLHERFDALCCPGDMRELVGLLSQCAQSGFLGPYLGAAGMEGDLLTRIAAEFSLTTLHPTDAYRAAPDADPQVDFATRYQELYGEPADAFAHRGWVALSCIARAVEAGGYCAEALRERLEDASARSLREGGGRRIEPPPTIAAPALLLRDGARERILLPLPPPPPLPVGPQPWDAGASD
ncbi:MAG: ABC transporter substrate-binding protein [Candidatus Eisenbacteria bacterium]|nr:ABC transporter substrate-binding protein [Candidatus Eisenbacteria bacterium]